MHKPKIRWMVVLLVLLLLSGALITLYGWVTDDDYEVPQKRWTSEIAGQQSPGRMFLCHDRGDRIPLSTGSRPHIG